MIKKLLLIIPLLFVFGCSDSYVDPNGKSCNYYGDTVWACRSVDNCACYKECVFRATSGDSSNTGWRVDDCVRMACDYKKVCR